MRSYRFVTVDVFTEQRFGGNPLAVFPDARGLSDAEMQSLATELNLSETTFVLPPENSLNTARVRIFNRTAEMPFAGHPNVGTAFVLAGERPDLGDTLRFEETAGLVEIEVDRLADGAVGGATIAAPQPLSLGMAFPADVIAACAGLDPSDIVVSTHQPVWATVGNSYVIAEVQPEALPRALPDLREFRAAAAARPSLNGRLSLYLYARDATDASALRARMFGPLAGTVEDPATGSAATPLGALLLSHDGGERRCYTINQGVEMGRPSLLHVVAFRAADDIRATVRGRCVPVFRGETQLA